MQKETLRFIKGALDEAGIHYEYGEFNSSIASLNSFWIGEYQETEPMTEDGLCEAQFILTGTGKGFPVLETDKQKIKEAFPEIDGKTAILESGIGVAIFYGSALNVPTGDARLKRLQVNLTIKEWKV